MGSHFSISEVGCAFVIEQAWKLDEKALEERRISPDPK